VARASPIYWFGVTWRRCLPGRSAASTAIAIDGPVAAGKSSVGSRVASALNWPFVDTGTMYRAITWYALNQGIDVNDPGSLGALASRVEMRVLPPEPGSDDYATVYVNREDATPFLRSPEVESAVSLVSSVPAVRRSLVELQRQLASHHPVVMAGRDIGTVVLINARLKVYLDASPETRAERRAAELERKGTPRPLEQVLSETLARDQLDSERAASPLRPADDAVHIGTDGVPEQDVVERILELAHRVFGSKV
jgi:cytidylate kinase